MFVDDMKHSKIELSRQLSLCIKLYTYFRRISSNDGIWLYANIALALHRGCSNILQLYILVAVTTCFSVYVAFAYFPVVHNRSLCLRLCK